MRDVASRLAAAAAVIASSILVPAAAQAKGGAVRSCAPSDRTFALALHSKGVSCSQARGIERHAGQHHWALPFRLYGRTWRGAIYSHAHNHTYVRLQSGPLTVWVTVAKPTPLGGLPVGDWDWWRWHQFHNSPS
jgi:hypothetical protein